MPQIQIQTTDIKLDFTIRDPQVQIKQPEAQVSIQQPAAILEIKTTNSELQTDMTQFYRDLGFKKVGEVISEFAQKGEQAAMQYIQKKASQGQQLKDNAGKDRGDDTIVSIIKQEHAPKMPPISNIRFIPSYQAIKISFTPSDIDINIKPQKVKIDAQINKPKIDLTYGDVTAKMVQRPDVHIDVIG